jgi:hypothetical protein
MIRRALPLNTSDGVHGGHLIECPACEYGHFFDLGWTFNGDLEKPTFSPSMLVYGGHNTPRCHSFVREGRIEYLSDCEHSMAGKTVDLLSVD